MERREVDVVVLGAGPGGYSAGIRLAHSGKRVALIEEREVGGTCLNRGCIPTKSLVNVASVVDWVKSVEQAGVYVNRISIHWPTLVSYKEGVVARLRSSLEGLIRSSGVDLINGHGRLISPQEIEVQGPTPLVVCAHQIIIATGSEPKSIPTIPFDGRVVLDSTAMLNVQTLPESIAIIGAGAIGCEFAYLFATMGVRVAIIEMEPRILPFVSEQVSKGIATAFTKQGIGLYCGEQVVSSCVCEDGIQIDLGSGKVLKASMAFVAAGRALNSEGIGLESIGLRIEKGAIVTDDRMATNVDGLWAVGDVTGRYLYEHVALHQGLVAADNILGKRKRMYYHAIPGALFTRPEAAFVGYSLEEAQRLGCIAKEVSFPMQALGRAHASFDIEGFVQVVFEERTGRILGAQALCPHASDLIAEMGLAIANELTLECVSETIHAHPTFAESWAEVCLLGQQEPLHFPKGMVQSATRG